MSNPSDPSVPSPPAAPAQQPPGLTRTSNRIPLSDALSGFDVHAPTLPLPDLDALDSEIAAPASTDASTAPASPPSSAPGTGEDAVSVATPETAPAAASPAASETPEAAAPATVIQEDGSVVTAGESSFIIRDKKNPVGAQAQRVAANPNQAKAWLVDMKDRLGLWWKEPAHKWWTLAVVAGTLALGPLGGALVLGFSFRKEIKQAVVDKFNQITGREPTKASRRRPPQFKPPAPAAPSLTDQIAAMVATPRAAPAPEVEAAPKEPVLSPAEELAKAQLLASFSPATQAKVEQLVAQALTDITAQAPFFTEQVLTERVQRLAEAAVKIDSLPRAAVEDAQFPRLVDHFIAERKLVRIDEKGKLTTPEVIEQQRKINAGADYARPPFRELLENRQAPEEAAEAGSRLAAAGGTAPDMVDVPRRAPRRP